MSELSDAKRRIIEILKRLDRCTVNDVARQLNTTATAVRQHLDALERSGLVERVDVPPSGRGRPAIHWRVTPSASELFPDRHGDLTVELLDSVRATFGEQAIDRVIARRAADQIEQYRAALGGRSLVGKVRALAERRSAEGYLAEVVTSGSDVVLIEHHCPICTAATNCPRLCSSELDVFRAALGPDVDVIREQHLLSGDSRCAYRIRPN